MKVIEDKKQRTTNRFAIWLQEVEAISNSLLFIINSKMTLGVSLNEMYIKTELLTILFVLLSSYLGQKYLQNTSNLAIL